MERLIIRNFGPISNIDIPIKGINIYHGDYSSGKSTIAKLISIFKGNSFTDKSNAEQRFLESLTNLNIDFEINESTLIRYEKDELYYEFTSKGFTTNITNENSTTVNPIYIPAERVFYTTFSQSVFSLLSSNIALPRWLVDFGARFENARQNIKKLKIDFLNAGYSLQDGTDYVQIDEKTSIKLSQASSGIQSVMPLLLVVQHYTEQKGTADDIFVIEEPELNLYPSTQKDLVEFIVERINRSDDNLIITTHSPYLLTTLDNLIQAGNIFSEKKGKKEELNSIIPESRWLKYDDVACYFFSEGTAISTLDEELKSIGPSNIDDVSEGLSDVFERLLKLKYS